MEWLFVGIGGGIGALFRYSVMRIVQKFNIPSYIATIIVNLFGSFFIGYISHLAIESSSLLTFLTIGVLGAFTTFSTFAFDIVNLLENKEKIKALIVIIINLIGGLSFFAIGWLFFK